MTYLACGLLGEQSSWVAFTQPTGQSAPNDWNWAIEAYLSRIMDTLGLLSRDIDGLRNLLVSSSPALGQNAVQVGDEAFVASMTGG